MANFEIDLEIQGKPFTIEVQAADENQARDFVSRQAASPDGARQVLQMAAEGKPEEAGFLRKAWDALAVPEQKAREGLGMLTSQLQDAPITGNLAADVAMGAPKIMAETIAEAAPGFVSRASIATAGGLSGLRAAAPAIKAAGRQVAKGAEAISGLEYKTKGLLSKTFEDPSLLLAEGTKKVGEKYVEAINKLNIRPSFGRATSPKELLDDALKASDDGSLTPEEALIARQTLDGIKKTIPRFSYNEMRKSFDAVAKTISKEADEAFSRAVKGEALRNLFPQNKLGGTSIMKGSLGALSAILGATGAGPAALIPTVAMSPLAQGSVAAMLGLGARGAAPLAREAVRTGGAVGGLLDAANRNPKYQRK